MDPNQGETRTYWPVFADIALILMLVFMLLLALQYVAYSDFFVRRELEAVQERVAESVRQAIGAEIAFEIPEPDGDQQTIRFDGRAVRFAEGDAWLSPEGVQLFTRLGRALAPYESLIETIHVVGHADPRPIREGSPLRLRFPTNWDLSSARAAAVVGVFADSAGFDPARISAVGRAETRRVAQGQTEEDYERDRRVEVVIQYSEALLRSVGSSRKVTER